MQKTQNKSKTMFIPDKALKQNLLPHQHKVGSPIWNISHIVSSLLHCGLQRNDQHRTHNQCLVPHLLPSNRQRKEQLGPKVRFRISWSVRRSWIPANPFLPSFWRTKKSTRRRPTGFGFSGLFCFIFLICLNKFFCKVNSLVSLLFHHEDLALGSGLAQRWYLMIGEPQQKWTAKN